MSHFTDCSIDQFKGKYALITGAANGIGLHIATELLKTGIEKVSVVDRMVALDSCRRLAAEFGNDRLIFIKCDVTNETEMENAFKITYEKFKQIDLVINNAGILNDALWEKEVLVNLNGTIRGTLLAFKHMSKAEGKSGGTIINVSSITGVRPSAGSPINCALSSGIIGLGAAFSMPYHFSNSGIRVMTICPGMTYTKLISGASAKMISADAGNEWLKELSTVPTQKPENVARGVIHMLVNGHNGSTWVCEGGRQAYEVNKTTPEDVRGI